VDLKSQFQQVADVNIRELTALAAPTAQVELLAAQVFGMAVTLAGQIDLLRSELVGKGIAVAQ